MSTNPVNLYGESHIPAAEEAKPKKKPLTDPFQLVRILTAEGPPHPALKLLAGTEYNPKNPAGTGLYRERKISVREVLARLRANDSFVYSVSQNGKRVKWIRAVRWRRHDIAAFNWTGFRPLEAAVLPPSPEWAKKMNANTSSFENSMIYGRSSQQQSRGSGMSDSTTKRAEANTGFSIRTVKP